MKIFLRILSLFYFVGFFLHLMDVTSLRLNFSEIPIEWKVWIVFLLIADLFAAIGLWFYKKWGIQLFLAIAILQLVAYSGVLDSPANQIFLISFHCLTLFTYFFLRYREASVA